MNNSAVQPDSAGSRLRLLDSSTLKLIAIVSMILDHTGAILFPQAMWMRAVGRLAMPIFAFFISEGFAHTRSRGKYLLRMGIFAVVSELPFDLAVFGDRKGLFMSHQNVMCTFFIAILALFCYESITAKKNIWRHLCGLAVLGAFCVLAVLLSTDYNGIGVLTVLVFYLLRGKPHILRVGGGMAAFLFFYNQGIYIYAALSSIPLLMYSGKRGVSLKWLFYAFYPIHLLALYFIRVLI